MAIQRYEADLHIHTVASPCGMVEMIPPLIIAAAQMAGLDMIAIVDHNCCENAGAVIEAAEGSGIRVLPGMEVQSVEGVHLLCLFDDLEQAHEMQESVYSSLPDVPGAARFIDEQFVVDAAGEFVSYCDRPISLPTRMEIETIWQQADRLGGMCIPSHIDKSGTGICGVLGMMPEEPVFEAVEISANLTPEVARVKYPSVGDLPIVQDSDAHWLDAIGEKRTAFLLEHRSLSEIRKALRGEGGRRPENA
jgi:PHP family Zn ribbon phosphoesterase